MAGSRGRTRGAKVETGEAPATGSRARARFQDPRRAKTPDERIEHIQAVMERGAWAPFRLRELAATWNLSLSRVKEHSAEASKRIREAQVPVEKTALRGDLTEQLRAWAAQDAEEGNRKAANKHVELVAKLHGLIVHQHEHAFQQEIADMLAVAKRVLPPEWHQKFLAALVAESKGDPRGELDA